MRKLVYKIKNFLKGLSNETLHRINRIAGIHVATFGILGIIGRLLTARKIEGFEFLYNWGVTADVGISIVTATLFILTSFMFYLIDIRISRNEKKSL